MTVHLLGIRHHGTGSARQVLRRLDALQPDLVLVEGPPEFDPLLRWVGTSDLTPPVALLGYDLANPQQATFYPFAEYSPEWQAIAWANQRRIPVRLLDLPLAHSFQQKINAATGHTQSGQAAEYTPRAGDPMSHLAALDGYADSERWWEDRFEATLEADTEAHFEAIFLAMKTLREAGVASSLDEENVAREAWMRHLIRQAQREMYSGIAVVCGAWHAPALTQLTENERLDNQLLKKLGKPKVKIETTWIPWTNQRLTAASGYGAGIVSPGWSAHRWQHPDDDGTVWLTHVARVFRQKKWDTATAHVIESQRLARTLAYLRQRPSPTLAELDEATVSVMCMGDVARLDHVREALSVGYALGQVPDALPRLPLQVDFESQCKQARLPLTADKKDYELDLRKDLDLRRSILLHRLEVLDIKWGRRTYARSKGTFREAWVLVWKAEMLVNLIEKGPLGNTVADAATRHLLDRAATATSIGPLAELIGQAIPAELFEAVEPLLRRLHELAVASADVLDLMAALVPMIEVSRYGNVRKSDLTALTTLAEGLLIRICVGLPYVVGSLDDDTAQRTFGLIRRVHDATRLLDNQELTQQWQAALRAVSDQSERANPLLVGCTTRLLLDARVLDDAEVARRFGLALSVGVAPADSAAWIEGFLKDSGMVLLYDPRLWNLLYRWTDTLPTEQFVELLPILRRTFSKFEPTERRQLGAKAAHGLDLDMTADAPGQVVASEADFDYAAARQATRLVEELLGILGVEG
jgi:hypothetical protein